MLKFNPSSVRRKALSVISAIGLIAVATGASTQLSASSTPPAAPAALPTQADLLRDQISADIRQALVRNAVASTQQEWFESGYTPIDIFNNVSALQEREAWPALCSALRELSDEDLTLFEDALRKNAKNPKLTCAGKLLAQIESHWRQARQEFAQERMIGVDPSLDQEAPEPFKVIEQHIDAAKGPVLENGDLKPMQVALTFDDGPHPSRTQAILAILKRYGARATFFQLGDNARAHAEISKQAATEGHTVGSHTVSHPQLPKLPVKDAEKEITAGRTMVSAASGMPADFFRFPYGASTPVLREFVRAQGMAMFFWNMDTLDWKIRDPKALYANALAELDREKRGILLFHDIHEQTTIVLPWFLDELQKRGYSLVTFVSH